MLLCLEVCALGPLKQEYLIHFMDVSADVSEVVLILFDSRVGYALDGWPVSDILHQEDDFVRKKRIHDVKRCSF